MGDQIRTWLETVWQSWWRIAIVFLSSIGALWTVNWLLLESTDVPRRIPIPWSDAFLYRISVVAVIPALGAFLITFVVSIAGMRRRIAFLGDMLAESSRTAKELTDELTGRSKELEGLQEQIRAGTVRFGEYEIERVQTVLGAYEGRSYDMKFSRSGLPERIPDTGHIEEFVIAREGRRVTVSGKSRLPEAKTENPRSIWNGDLWRVTPDGSYYFVIELRHRINRHEYGVFTLRQMDNHHVEGNYYSTDTRTRVIFGYEAKKLL